MTHAEGPYGIIDYSYDGVGNRLAKTENSITTAYTYYPGTNRLHEVVTGAETVAGSKLFTYNQDNRLIRVEENSVTLGEYTYNGLGQRIIKNAGGITTVFHYDFDGNIIAESDQTGSILKEYLYKGSSRLAMVDVLTGNIYYYGNDKLGTPQIMTDSTNTVVWEGEYKPFGEADVNPNSSVVNNFRFPGQYYDQETGLHYNYHRYYDPKTGRYLTPDPIGLAGGINLFTYALDNPINVVDLWGLIWEYSISTGQLWHFPSDGGAAEFAGEGYSGKSEGLNNPLYQLEPNVGPIPEGEWRIGLPYNSPYGNPTFRLTPMSGTETPGRDPHSFLIHADNPCECFDASEGCIVLSKKDRKKIARSGDRNLRVVP